jgi:hypothetical protein
LRIQARTEARPTLPGDHHPHPQRASVQTEAGDRASLVAAFIHCRLSQRPSAQIAHSTLKENILNSTQLASLACAALLFAGAAAYSADDSKSDGQRETTTHRDFDTVDTHKHGYVTANDVKSDEYVRKNFAKCNVKHNGHMSREEYTNCHE